MVTLIKETSNDAFADNAILEMLVNRTSRVEEVLEDEDSLFIYNVLKGIKQELSYIRLENEVFTYFLRKNSPQSLRTAVKRQESRVTKVIFTTKENASFQSERGTSSRFSIFSQRDIVATSVSSIGLEKTLTSSVKRELAEKQVQEYEFRTRKLEEEGRKNLRSLRAEIVALRIDLVDAEEFLENFNNVIGNSGEKEKSAFTKNKISTERFMKYCTNWLNNAQAFINTIRLRSGTLSTQALQQKAANARKRDLKGLLMPVDFEKIRIVKNKHEIEIEEQTSNLQGLKALYGGVSFTLSMEKRNLIQAEEKVNEMKRSIRFAKNQLKKVNREIDIVEEEARISKKQLIQITKQMEDYVAPSIEDYFALKIKLAVVEKEEKQLERQNYILGIKLQNYKVKLAKQKRLQMK